MSFPVHPPQIHADVYEIIEEALPQDEDDVEADPNSSSSTDVQCQRCLRIFTAKSDLVDHIQQFHPE